MSGGPWPGAYGSISSSDSLTPGAQLPVSGFYAGSSGSSLIIPANNAPPPIPLKPGFKEKTLTPRPWVSAVVKDEDDGVSEDSFKGKNDKTRGGYKCGRCGQPKKGHVCTNKPRLRTAYIETVSTEVQAECDPALVLRHLHVKAQGLPESYGLDNNWRPRHLGFPPNHNVPPSSSQTLPYTPPNLAPPAETYYHPPSFTAAGGEYQNDFDEDNDSPYHTPPSSPPYSSSQHPSFPASSSPTRGAFC